MSAASSTIIAGRYELQRRLAQGGMAEVWLAVDLTLNRRVAVKWLKPMLATDEIVAERFRREAIAAASLSHPNIVAVHDVFEQDGRQAVVMQLVDGKSLRQLLDTQQRLSPELTCHIGSAVAAALDHAHGAGFVHRDVKPGNIMITADGRVLLTDFGIAKGLHGDSGDDLTSDNIMMGTAKYLSPEQVRGKKLDGRADLYSLGLVLYECLAGRVPFLGESDADTALARLQRDPTDLSRLRATLPTRLVTVIHDLLARNPDNRPATGDDLIAELKVATSEGTPAIDETNPERSPVAPFSAGRLMRAPSDLRGRARDRSRGTRTPTPPRGKTKRDGAPSRPTPRPGDRRNGASRSESGPRDTAPAAPSASNLLIGPIDPMLDSGRISIPGEPDHITGRVPVQQPPPEPSTTTARAGPNRAPETAPRRDRTPPAGHLRGAPAKGMGQTWRPSMAVVGGLIIVAIVVAALLLAALNLGGGDAAPITSALPGDATADGRGDAGTDQTGGEGGEVLGDDDADTDGAGAEPVDPARPRIVSVMAYDPDGDDDGENDDRADEAIDGDPSTAWRTSCYSDQYMGVKLGVGLVVSFDAAIQRPLVVDVDNGPYTVDFRGVDADAIPADFDGWGTAFDEQFSTGDQGGVITSAAPNAPVRHVLVLLRQLGSDGDCSADNPFRNGFANISLAD